MFPMIMNCGQKMIERIDMQIGNRIKQTINTKDVSSEPFPHSLSKTNLYWNEVLYVFSVISCFNC